VHYGFEGSLFSSGALPNLERANARYIGSIQATALNKNGIMSRPVGRPLAGHAWRDGAWVHEDTGLPYSEEAYKAGVLRRQAECERRRYWDTSSGTRQRRLQRAKREALARPPKRDNAMTQLTLDHHLGARGSHPQLTPGEQSTTKLVGASV
jgi:hypothetical protein